LKFVQHNGWNVSQIEHQHNIETDVCILTDLRDILVAHDFDPAKVGIFIGNYFPKAKLEELIAKDQIPITREELDSGIFLFDQDEAEKRDIVFYSVGSSARGTYLPAKSDTDIDMVLMNEESIKFKQVIADTILRHVPAVDQLGRKGSDFDDQPRMAYTFRSSGRVDLSIRPKYDVRTLDYILSMAGWTDEMKYEIRRAKQFFVSKGVYHRSNHGLNGITVERLIQEYGSLELVCEKIIEVGLPKDLAGTPSKKDVVPIDESGFEIKFPNNDEGSKGIMNWWVSQNPKMWQRIVLAAHDFTKDENAGCIKNNLFNYRDLELDYLSDPDWFVFPVNTRLDHIKDVERIIFEKAKEYLTSHPDRIEDFEIYSWKDQLGIAFKPKRRFEDQSFESCVDEQIKFFRNHLFANLNEFMAYPDPDNFAIRPAGQLRRHGHKKTGPKYVLLTSNPRYKEVLTQIFGDPAATPKTLEHAGLRGEANFLVLPGAVPTEVNSIGQNIVRYSFEDGFEFDLICCSGQTSAMKWAEIGISFGAEYIVAPGICGSLVDELPPGSVVLTGEFARLDRKGDFMGTDPTSFYVAPLNRTRPTSSPILQDHLISALNERGLSWDVGKCATIPIYYQTDALIRRARDEGYATIIDEEDTNVAAVAGFRSGKLSLNDGGRVHFCGLHFVTDVYLRGGGHHDLRGDYTRRDNNTLQIVDVSVTALHELYLKKLQAGKAGDCCKR